MVRRYAYFLITESILATQACKEGKKCRTMQLLRFAIDNWTGSAVFGDLIAGMFKNKGNNHD